MDRLDQISKALRENKKNSEEKVQNAHRNGNQIVYGGYKRIDASCDHHVDE
jgi:hypothetical protein